MKVLITEKEGEGLVGLLGKKVTLFCMNYFYHGVLEGVNDTCVKLKDAYIVYETGAFDSEGFKDAQKLAPTWYVSTAAIESYGVFTNK
jgi:hypothetical protein